MSGKRATAGRTGVFIDFSNLFGAIGKKDSKTGEQVNYFVCYQKLREYLEGVHNSPVFYNLYACVDSNPKAEPYITRSKKHASFLNFLSGIGYNVIKKELKYLPNNTTKCDTDLETVVDIFKHQEDVDNIILFTGDSDFLTVVKKFQQSGKYIHIYSFASSLSWELKVFAQQTPRCNYTLLDDIKHLVSKDE